jgi:intergrase/recombinase
MAGQVVQMDYAVVGEVSKGFSTAAQTLRTIAKILQALVQTLRAMAFASMGTSLALANYYDTIRQKMEKLAKVCEEFSQDLARAIDDHKKGDIKGKKYFGQGISV